MQLTEEQRTIIRRILAATEDGRLKWHQEFDGCYSPNIGTDNEKIIIRRMFIEATNQVGADPYFVQFSMPGWNGRYAVVDDSEGWQSFESQVSSTEANRSRDYYVSPEDADKLLTAAPDAQWRLLIALWRLAGLRKMEVFNLTWGDVLWDQGKLRVRSTKTEHIDGCEMRYVPLRDVRRYLDAAFDEATDGSHKIITRFSPTNSNLDKPFKRIIEVAGLTPWPKLFQNMRSSCETQWLKEGERADLVANWIGHSVKVQNKNYVQHTEEDIKAFSQKPSSKSGSLLRSDDVRNGEKRPEVAEYPAHSSPSKNTDDQCFSYSNSCQRLPRAGLEPARSDRNPRF